ncbi:hypothetical protein DYI37_03295 [Fulvimarina endophytica]|uniref:XRE family transcriptional regulator n=1 Tax=Fulvimarina endophytica TaxID=2293836 RepID=A0A371XBB5_9HYPH|nr:hypothetical protein [Fulvimarina endophytica]RFC66481.1 hypothetical protein DYI37_03295 [Fulvimarina endophytica]
MQTPSDIINSLGGNAAIARKLGISPSGVSEMKRRNSIPVKYWSGLIEIANEGGHTLSADMLISAHANEVAA